MISAVSSLLRPALVTFAVLTALTGAAYPLVVTGIGHAVFPEEAAGSLITRGGKPIGSALIGQNFSDSRYIWGRPSATAPTPYNATASSGSNLGPLNPALVDAVKGRIEALRAADPGNTAPVPVDLVTASGSGLDEGAQPVAEAGARPDRAAHPRPLARLPRRAARQRAAPEPRARCDTNAPLTPPKVQECTTTKTARASAC
jgi:K+-transporting ATPase ATPase C chain